MKSRRWEQEQHAAPDVGQLLYRLKATVERVLLSRASGVGGNIWLGYGGLIDLVVACIVDILRHGLKSQVRENEVLVEWLKNSFGYPIDSIDQWIRDSLLQYCLRDQFNRLLHSRATVEEIYCPDAYLRLPPYVESLFSCLMSLEEQQHRFLTDIDPALYTSSVHGKSLNEMRSLSFPVLTPSVHKFTSCSNFSDGSSHKLDSSHLDGSRCCLHCVNEVVEKLVSTVSSHVYDQQQNESRGLTDSLSLSSAELLAPVSQSSTSSSSGATKHRRTKSDEVFVRRSPLTIAPRNRLTPTQNAAPATLPRDSERRASNFSLIRESWLEAAKLSEYIAQMEYETSLELERENAHFLLSEMLIGAIEQMKWRNILSSQLPDLSVGSPHQVPCATAMDEELSSASYEGFSGNSGDFQLSGDFSWQQNESAIADAEPMPSTSADTGYNTDSQQNQVRNVPPMNATSAESVAMNLLQRFSQKHFSPLESNELKYMVSYKDVPQLLLPLPRSVPVAPDEVYAEGFKQKVKLRGTFEWAPPRPQLIFQMHPVPKLKILLEQQSYKCAGCGMKLDKAYFKRLRFCTYLGKLFCQCCHQGQTSVIPAFVLHQWDFRRLPVSDFSYRFITQQNSQPVWDVKAINESLYKTVKPLRAVRHLRQQLKYCYDYIRTCRLAKDLITTSGRLTDVFEKIPPHLVQEVDIYSMQDFLQVKDGTLYTKLEAALLLARYHIEGCHFCRAKGFVCEVCRKDEILFPFQSSNRVKRCGACGSCFHVKCLRKRDCPKCRRLQLRRELAEQGIAEQENEFDL